MAWRSAAPITSGSIAAGDSVLAAAFSRSDCTSIGGVSSAAFTSIPLMRLATTAGLAPSATCMAPSFNIWLIGVPSAYLVASKLASTDWASIATWVLPWTLIRLPASCSLLALRPTRPNRFLSPIRSARILAASSAFCRISDSTSVLPNRSTCSPCTTGALRACCSTSLKAASVMSLPAMAFIAACICTSSRPLPPSATALPSDSRPSTASWKRLPGSRLSARP